jgi:hypothetical protein
MAQVEARRRHLEEGRKLEAPTECAQLPVLRRSSVGSWHPTVVSICVNSESDKALFSQKVMLWHHDLNHDEA